MKLRDYLAVPYMIEAAPVETRNGEWVRRLRYPELGDFAVETLDVEAGLRELEIIRIQEILRLLRAGELPPTPRPPLRNANPEWQARALGVWDLVGEFLDLTPHQISHR